jgi:DUF4097 and DUF4098 domain-containing protein YvlB
MLRARYVLTALLACCLLPALAAAAETERFHKVVPVGPGGTVKLSTFSGFVHITGADVSQVTIDAVRRAERDRLDHIKLDVQASGNLVTIDANKKDETWEEKNNNVVETEFEIQVPRDTRLDIHSFSSPITVAGVSASQTLETFSGRIQVQDAPAQVNAKTFSAGVDLKLAPAVVEPSFAVETFSGGIDLRMTDAARARVEFNTFSGDMTSDLPLTLQKQSRKHLIGDLGGGGNTEVRLKTFSGSVRILR